VHSALGGCLACAGHRCSARMLALPVTDVVCVIRPVRSLQHLSGSWHRAFEERMPAVGSLGGCQRARVWLTDADAAECASARAPAPLPTPKRPPLRIPCSQPRQCCRGRCHAAPASPRQAWRIPLGEAPAAVASHTTAIHWRQTGAPACGCGGRRRTGGGRLQLCLVAVDAVQQLRLQRHAGCRQHLVQRRHPPRLGV
jgi:hypothetical protein